MRTEPSLLKMRTELAYRCTETALNIGRAKVILILKRGRILSKEEDNQTSIVPTAIRTATKSQIAISNTRKRENNIRDSGPRELKTNLQIRNPRIRMQKSIHSASWPGILKVLNRQTGSLTPELVTICATIARCLTNTRRIQILKIQLPRLDQILELRDTAR